ncbi:MAG TPA: YfhO family protein [Thermoanaerobaculia bacterium]|nr:YfhO family protein [Thermoanaerobaculia bacterium]
MNAALPVLVALSLAGLCFRRHEVARAWVVVGLAATALLLPVLWLPDGVPSPSGTLGRLSPWQGTVEPDGMGDLLDVTFKIEPWLLFVREELRAGRLPFWNPHQFAGHPLWANGQAGPLFPFHLLFSFLPLPLGWILLPWLRLVTAGMGAYLLARELRTSHQGGLLAALLFCLTGRLVAFLLFPMANALALVPWAFFFVERLARGGRGVRGLAVISALQLLAGHPETAVYTALVSAVYLGVRRAEPLVATWLRWGAGWGLGALLAAVEVVPVVLHLTQTSRFHDLAPGPPLSTVETGALLLRFLLPDAWGHVGDASHFGPLPFVATTVYAGALTLPLAAAALASWQQDRTVQALGAAGLFGLAAAVGLPGLHQALGALPLVGKGVHHYLLLGTVLALALLAAVGFDRWRAGHGQGLLAGGALVGLGLAWGWWALGGEWIERGLIGRQLGWTALLGVVAIGLPASLRLGADRRGRWAAAVLVVAAADLLFAHSRSVPALAAAELHPETPALAFLQGRAGRVAGVDLALRPNTATVHGLLDLRGDDSTKLARFERFWARELGEGHATDFRTLSRWQSPWLDELGVRWVLAAPGASAQDPAWTVAYRAADAVVFERPNALPLMRLEPPEAGRLEVLGAAPGHREIALDLTLPARLVVAESWDRGWRAWVDGRGAQVLPHRDLVVGIDLQPGQHRLRLRYRPYGFSLGITLSLLGLTLLLSVARRAG